ncbi:hypothetical protein BDQ12DRAFT_665223 [Crucibulum laeve]|uniref:Uncharacterized protein n=1 Tax=Crucibulum laeve TaxID=68775 RepID=A0A5C3ME05_9AGAR|nr:hypothetical protein BDQ12DRAFT_665223 [Crucibulum laeve]
MSSPYGTGPRSCDEEYLANQFNDLFKPMTPVAVRVEPHIEVQIQAILSNRTFWDDMPMGRSPLSDVANKPVNLPAPSFVAPVSRKACTYNSLATEAKEIALVASSPFSSRQNTQREEYAKLRKARVMAASPHDSPTPQPRHALVQVHSTSLTIRRSSPLTQTVSARRVSLPARQPPRLEHRSQPLSKPSQSIRQPLQSACKPPHPAPVRRVPSALSSGDPVVDVVLAKAAEKAAFNREAKQIRKIRAEAAAKGLRIPTEDELRKASKPSAAPPCRLPLAAIPKQRSVSAPLPQPLPVPAPFLQQEMSEKPSAVGAKRIPNSSVHPTLAFSPYRPAKPAFQPMENRAYSPGIEILSSPPVASKSIFERGLTEVQLRNIALRTPVGNKDNERTGAQRTIPVQVREKEKTTVKLFNEEEEREKPKEEETKENNESKLIVKDEPSPGPSILIPSTVMDSPLPSPPPSPPMRSCRLPRIIRQASESSPKVLPTVAPVSCSPSLPATSKTPKKIIPANQLVDVDVHAVSLASGPVKTDEKITPPCVLSPSPSARPVQSASPSSISAAPQFPALREPEDMDTLEDAILRSHLMVVKENMGMDVDLASLVEVEAVDVEVEMEDAEEEIDFMMMWREPWEEWRPIYNEASLEVDVPEVEALALTFQPHLLGTVSSASGNGDALLELTNAFSSWVVGCEEEEGRGKEDKALTVANPLVPLSAVKALTPSLTSQPATSEYQPSTILQSTAILSLDPFDSCLERQAPSIYIPSKVKETQLLRSAHVKRSLAIIWLPQLRSNASRVVASGLSASKLVEAKALEIAISRVSMAGRYFAGLRCSELLSGAHPVQRELAVNGKTRWAKRAANSEFVQTREVPSAFSKNLPEPLVLKQHPFLNEACYSVGVWRGFSLR